MNPGVFSVEKNPQGDWSFSGARVISSDRSSAWASLQSQHVSEFCFCFVFFFFARFFFFFQRSPRFLYFPQRYMTFSKQALIQHFVSATETGTPSPRNSFYLVYVTGEQKLCTMWQRRLREEPRRSATPTRSSSVRSSASPGSFPLLPTTAVSPLLSSPVRASRFGTSSVLSSVARDKNPKPRRLATKAKTLVLPFAETLIPHRSLSGS